MSSDENLIAVRYVRALFALATEQKAHDNVKKDMLVLASLLAESKDLQKLFVNPIITREQSQKLIEAVLTKAGACDLTKSFFTVLAHQRRLAIAALIIEQYLAMLAESRGEITADVTSATELDAKEVKLLSESLTKATGKKVHVRTHENAALIGGVQLRIGSQMLDNTIATKLARLRQTLTRAA